MIFRTDRDSGKKRILYDVTLLTLAGNHYKADQNQ
jgi:hypothetical protein